MDTTEKLDQVTNLAMDRLADFFRKKEPTSLDIGAARVASSAVASYARIKQADSAREGMVMAMARELAEDKGELRKYLKVALPSTSGARRMLDPKALAS